MTAIVSTCGTSVLTNEANLELRKLITACANDTAASLASDAKERLDAWIDDRRDALAGADVATVRRLSAELNGLLAWYGEKWPQRSSEELHWLIHTDTYLGTRAAELVADWMRDQGLSVQFYSPRGLNTADALDFEGAMSDLAKWCYDSFEGDPYEPLVFNLVGGFKSLQGFMQALGMFYAHECIYIFETGQALLRIPRLPIRLGVDDALREHASAFLRLEVWGQARADQCEGIRETLLLSVDDERSLSAWGQFLWEKSKEAVLGERLLDPLTDRLRWGPGFISEAAHLQPDLQARLNRQLARLARCIEGGGEKGDYNPSSLDFKQLQGKHYDSTHECDAFGGNDPRRLFGHYEGPVFVVDRLGPHL